ncbi:predicted protein [Histoplasma capsulatum var. duboisii H88]|uniref:Predicted protein n=1 Tax=Ajellomyces capsulatus (strain H88) TaxID=544711 RepID=F0UI35_AJEC8|nr:predicted protein [Histoplasma capsulatum var. duboisii H88]
MTGQSSSLQGVGWRLVQSVDSGGAGGRETLEPSGISWAKHGKIRDHHSEPVCHLIIRSTDCLLDPAFDQRSLANASKEDWGFVLYLCRLCCGDFWALIVVPKASPYCTAMVVHFSPLLPYTRRFAAWVLYWYLENCILRASRSAPVQRTVRVQVHTVQTYADAFDAFGARSFTSGQKQLNHGWLDLESITRSFILITAQGAET